MKIAENVFLLASSSLGTGMSHSNDCNVYAGAHVASHPMLAARLNSHGES